MAYEMKPGQGSLFKNDKKTTEQHPEYKGSAMLLDGTEVWLSAWVKRPDGKPAFMSISIQPKQEQQPAKVETVKAEVVSDDLPF